TSGSTRVSGERERIAVRLAILEGFRRESSSSLGVEPGPRSCVGRGRERGGSPDVYCLEGLCDVSSGSAVCHCTVGGNCPPSRRWSSASACCRSRAASARRRRRRHHP